MIFLQPSHSDFIFSIKSSKMDKSAIFLNKNGMAFTKTDQSVFKFLIFNRQYYIKLSILSTYIQFFSILPKLSLFNVTAQPLSAFQSSENYCRFKISFLHSFGGYLHPP